MISSPGRISRRTDTLALFRPVETNWEKKRNKSHNFPRYLNFNIFEGIGTPSIWFSSSVQLAYLRVWPAVVVDVGGRPEPELRAVFPTGEHDGEVVLARGQKVILLVAGQLGDAPYQQGDGLVLVPVLRGADLGPLLALHAVPVTGFDHKAGVLFIHAKVAEGLRWKRNITWDSCEKKNIHANMCKIAVPVHTCLTLDVGKF